MLQISKDLFYFFVCEWYRWDDEFLRFSPPVSERLELDRSAVWTNFNGARQSAVCPGCQNVQRREKVVVPKPTWISRGGTPDSQTCLTLRGQDSLLHNLIDQQRLEIVGFDPLRRP